ncbi:hypothetical protein D1B31_11025 [Neobacillus notoginsengisoli]|uniref:Uncharacterized protein n=1 Tax=Neobacillus notoginsengisoli TaxID=1578198 RepID=A0A417YU56_9BACI|nr:hypothetical protein D1B31_11025 [Neobacillus notoginsengisoli]
MIVAEGTKTPAGCSGKVATPQAPMRRGGSTDAPRKAKCLERKSTTMFKKLSSFYLVKLYLQKLSRPGWTGFAKNRRMLI